MTKISNKPLTCPSCGYHGEYKMYDSVNVTLEPKLREKVLSGTIFDWVCPHCGESISIRYNMLYHDMDRGFQVYYSPRHSSETNKMMNNLLTRYRGMRCLCRTVETLNDLREKIYIFEEGLNDIAIELLKLVMKYEKGSNIPEECELRFQKMTTKNQMVFCKIIDGHPQEGYLLLDKSNYDNYLHEVSTNPKYKMDKYCDIIDVNWIINHMK